MKKYIIQNLEEESQMKKKNSVLKYFKIFSIVVNSVELMKKKAKTNPFKQRKKQLNFFKVFLQKAASRDFDIIPVIQKYCLSNKKIDLFSFLSFFESNLIFNKNEINLIELNQESFQTNIEILDAVLSDHESIKKEKDKWMNKYNGIYNENIRLIEKSKDNQKFLDQLRSDNENLCRILQNMKEKPSMKKSKFFEERIKEDISEDLEDNNDDEKVENISERENREVHFANDSDTFGEREPVYEEPMMEDKE